MSFKKYLREVEDQKIDDNKMGAIFDFFANNPDPKDEDVHKLADDLGIDHDKFEAMIYSILSSILAHGRYKENPVEPDPNELKMGIEVEKEHTTMDAIARRIALDHLSEDKLYYTHLREMEDKYQVEK